jgi:hypothetical protein
MLQKLKQIFQYYNLRQNVMWTENTMKSSLIFVYEQLLKISTSE